MQLSLYQEVILKTSPDAFWFNVVAAKERVPGTVMEETRLVLCVLVLAKFF